MIAPKLVTAFFVGICLYAAILASIAGNSTAEPQTQDPPEDPFILFEDGCFGEIQGYIDPRTGQVGIEFRYDCWLLGIVPPGTWFRIAPDGAQEAAYEFHGAGGTH